MSDSSDSGIRTISTLTGEISLLGEDKYLLILGKSRYRTFVAGAFVPWDSALVEILDTSAGYATVKTVIPKAWILYRDVFILIEFVILTMLGLSLLS
jgi:hypothetical protein